MHASATQELGKKRLTMATAVQQGRQTPHNACVHIRRENSESRPELRDDACKKPLTIAVAAALQQRSGAPHDARVDGRHDEGVGALLQLRDPADAKGVLSVRALPTFRKDSAYWKGRVGSRACWKRGMLEAEQVEGRQNEREGAPLPQLRDSAHIKESTLSEPRLQGCDWKSIMGTVRGSLTA